MSPLAGAQTQTSLAQTPMRLLRSVRGVAKALSFTTFTVPRSLFAQTLNSLHHSVRGIAQATRLRLSLAQAVLART